MDSSFAIPSDGVLTSNGTSTSRSTLYRSADGELPKAKDMSNHLNTLAKNRSPSSLKELYKYSAIPGMGEFVRGDYKLTQSVSMGGGEKSAKHAVLMT